jgi:hypothetical protein
MSLSEQMDEHDEAPGAPPEPPPPQQQYDRRRGPRRAPGGGIPPEGERRSGERRKVPGLAALIDAILGVRRIEPPGEPKDE